MKIYINLNASEVKRLEGLELLTSNDRLSMVCENSSNFEFKVEEVRDILNSPGNVSLIVTEKNADDTIKDLVETLENREETFVVDGKNFVSIKDVFNRMFILDKSLNI